MAIGIITGSGTYALPGFEGAAPERVDDAVGADGGDAGRAGRRRGRARVPPRRGPRAALQPRGAPREPRRARRARRRRRPRGHRVRRGRPGRRARLADLLRRPALPVEPAARRRAVHVLRRGRRPAPRALDLRGPVLARAARGAARRRPRGAGLAMRDGGCYGHVDGPRFNTKAEIRGLAATRRHRRLADRRAGDRARGGGRAAVRARRLRDGLRQRRPGRSRRRSSGCSS